jgi:hypothetical protein
LSATAAAMCAETCTFACGVRIYNDITKIS